MRAGVITEGLPEGWMISTEYVFSGADCEPVYTARRWGTAVQKKFLRKPVTMKGWVKAGFQSRWEEDTRAWILSTDAALKKEALS